MTQRRSMRFILNLAAIVLLPVWVSVLQAAEFHVAPNGNDTGPGTKDQPFATLERARDAMRGQGGGDVIIHGGVYTLAKTFVLTPQDSGVAGKPVRYVAATGEKPVFTSAREISGWRKHDANVWVAEVPMGWRFHFLYVDGKPQPVARMNKSDNWRTWPKPVKVGKVEPAGQLFTLARGALDGLPSNGDVEMDLMPVEYWNTISVVRNIDADKSTCRRHSKSPTTFWPSQFGYRPDQFGNYNLLNGLKFLTLPGEWCVDSAAGKVYYRPVSGEPAAHKIWAPAAYRLVEFKGSDTARVHDVEFRGITFTCTDRLPEDQWPDEWVKRQAELPDAMLFMEGVESCVVDSCTFTYSGSYAITLQNFAQKNRVTRNEMGWLGCGGVLLQGYGPGTTDVNKDNVIRRNYIHHTGNGGYLHSAAITLYQSGGNDIVLNWIDNVPYAGVQIAGAAADEFGTGKPQGAWDSYGNFEAMYKVRWSEIPGGRHGKFTRASFKPFLHSRNNRICDNILMNYMARTSDGGALYCWSCGLGNLWQGNLLCRRETKADERWCFALYMDDHVDGATLRNNICWHAGNATINKGNNKWENNVVSRTKPTGYDARLAEIIAQSQREGGWLRTPETVKP